LETCLQKATKSHLPVLKSFADLLSNKANISKMFDFAGKFDNKLHFAYLCVCSTYRVLYGGVV
jgi:hypothetical protein